MVALVNRYQLVRSDASGHGKCTDVVDHAALDWRDEVRQRAIRLAVANLLLLAEHVEDDQGIPAGCGARSIQDDVFAVGIGWPEAIYATQREQPLAHDTREQRLRMIVQLTCS